MSHNIDWKFGVLLRADPVYIAYAFPTKLYGRLVGISEIFSTLAGIVIVPIAKSIIFSGKAQ